MLFVFLTSYFTIQGGDHSSTVVKVLCYNSEGRWFDSRWFHWNTLSDRTMAVGSTQPLNRNE